MCGLNINHDISLQAFILRQLLICHIVCYDNHEAICLMMTSSYGNISRITGHLCGEFTGEFPAQKPVTWSFDVFFDLRPNKRLSK